MNIYRILRAFLLFATLLLSAVEPTYALWCGPTYVRAEVGEEVSVRCSIYESFSLTQEPIAKRTNFTPHDFPEGASLYDGVSSCSVSFRASEPGTFSAEVTAENEDGSCTSPIFFTVPEPHLNQEYDNFYQRQCTKDLEAWSEAMGKDPDAEELEVTHINGVPSEYYSWLQYFSLLTKQEMPLHVKQRHLYESIIWLLEYPSQTSASEQTKNLIRSYVKDIPIEEIDSDFERGPVTTRFLDPFERGRVEPAPRMRNKMPLNWAINVAMLSRFVRDDFDNPNIIGTYSQRIRNLVEGKLRAMPIRGGSFDDLLFAYMISNPELNLLGLPITDEIKAEIAEMGDRFLLNKTTPSLACNLAAGLSIAKPLQWDDLGMGSYYNEDEQWLPWVHPWIVKHIGRFAYDHPLAWNIAKMIPVVGTAMSICDNSLSLSEAINSEEDLAVFKYTALLAFDALSVAFDAAAVSSGVSAYRSLASQAKADAAALKASGNVDEAVKSLNFFQRTLKRVGRFKDEAENLGTCVRGAGIRGRLVSSLGDLQGFKEAGSNPLQNGSMTKCGVFVPESVFADSNILVSEAKTYDFLIAHPELGLANRTLASFSHDEMLKVLYTASKQERGEIIRAFAFAEKMRTPDTEIFLTPTVVNELLSHLVDTAKFSELALKRAIEQSTTYVSQTFHMYDLTKSGVRWNPFDKMNSVLKEFYIGNELKAAHDGFGDRFYVLQSIFAWQKNFGTSSALKPIIVSSDNSLMGGIAGLSGKISERSAANGFGPHPIEVLTLQSGAKKGVDLLFSEKNMIYGFDNYRPAHLQSNPQLNKIIAERSLDKVPFRGNYIPTCKEFRKHPELKKVFPNTYKAYDEVWKNPK